MDQPWYIQDVAVGDLYYRGRRFCVTRLNQTTLVEGWFASKERPPDCGLPVTFDLASTWFNAKQTRGSSGFKSQGDRNNDHVHLAR